MTDQKSLPASQLTLPVIPVREGVLFPSTESVLTFGRRISLQALKSVKGNGKYVVLLTQKKSSLDKPKSSDLYQLGTLAIIERTLETGESMSALVRGVGRVKVKNFIQSKPFLLADVEKIYDLFERDEELTALNNQLQKLFKQTIQMGKQVEFLNFIKLLSGVNEGEMADQIASTLSLSTKEKQEILEISEVKKRIKRVIFYLSKEIKVLEIEKDVSKKTQAKFDKNMRESILRERLHTIQKELGEIDDEEEIINDYSKKLSKLKIPTEIKDRVKKEIKKLSQMSPNNPEGSYIRSWLDLVFELPFDNYKGKEIDIKQAEKL